MRIPGKNNIFYTIDFELTEHLNVDSSYVNTFTYI